MHNGAEIGFDDLQWKTRAWNATAAYSQSELHMLLLAFSVARHWPDTLANAVDPGWSQRGWAAHPLPMTFLRAV
jgi:hypothetical protein